MERTSAVESIRPDRVAVEPSAMTSKNIALIGHVQVTLSAQIGTVDMSVERLFALKSGEQVVLNELLDAPVTLMLNGRAIASAELVAVDDHFGVRILDIA